VRKPGGGKSWKIIPWMREVRTYTSATVNPIHSEERKMSDKKDFFGGIASKLAILMGGAVLVTGAQASVPSVPVLSSTSNGISLGTASLRMPLPAKLILKQQVNGFKMIASHASHSSHASHASHASHSSHSSRAA
jgi:hypothetical protein